MKIDSYEIQFDRSAREVDEDQFRQFKDALSQHDYTDILVLAHGWNNNIEEARGLYTHLLEKICLAIDVKNDTSKRFVSLNVLWPSKRFTEKELIPGQAAGLSDVDDQETQILVDAWSAMKDLFAGNEAMASFDKILAGIKRNEDRYTLAHEFHKILSSIDSNEDESPFKHLRLDDLQQFLSDDNVPNLKPIEQRGGAASVGTNGNDQHGQAQSLFSPIKQGIANLLNLTTYYTMKNRAGEIGAALNEKLAELRGLFPDKDLHLIGHSFGARLVTAAVLGPNDINIKTLALVQAAFSHYAFANLYDDVSNGFFRSVLTEKKIQGALLITHTRADKAVGVAYALASRLAKQIASDTGDKDSPYGGLGGNGAQKTPGVVNEIDLQQAADENHFETGKTYNLLSDAIIGGHSDIIKDELGAALVNAFYL